jgi:hypothetical protein
MANLVDWLTPGLPYDASENLGPGQALTIYPGDAEFCQVTLPDGRSWTTEPGEGPLIFDETDQLGLYQVSLDGQEIGRFGVNLFDPDESTLSRHESITVGQETIDSNEGQAWGQKELWRWPAAMAFVLLMLEWWVYHRGARLPKRKSLA